MRQSCDEFGFDVGKVGIGPDERHIGNRFKRQCPLEHQIEIPQIISMIGGEHDDSVVILSVVLERLDELTHGIINLGFGSKA